MAGKFRPICTEFPLATFSAKILTRLPLKFPPKYNSTTSRAKNRGFKKIKRFSKCFVSKKSWLSNLFLLDFDSLHEILSESSFEKAPWQVTQGSTTNHKISYYMSNPFFFFCKIILCQDVLSEQISLKQPHFECNTRHSL